MENGGRGSHPIPQTGAKPFLTGADQGLEGKDRVGGHNRRRGFATQPPKLPSRALRLCLGDLAYGPEPSDPQLCKGRRAGAGWLSSPQQLVPAQGPGKAPSGQGKMLVTLLGLALGLPKGMPGSRPHRERGCGALPGQAWPPWPTHWPVSPPSLAET